jgi:hypothetical protein
LAEIVKKFTTLPATNFEHKLKILRKE